MKKLHNTYKSAKKVTLCEMLIWGVALRGPPRALETPPVDLRTYTGPPGVFRHDSRSHRGHPGPTYPSAKTYPRAPGTK